MRTFHAILFACLLGLTAFGADESKPSNNTPAAGSPTIPPPPLPKAPTVNRSNPPVAIAPPRVQTVERNDQSAALQKIEEKISELAKKQDVHMQRTAAFSGDIMVLSAGVILLAVLSLIVILYLIKLTKKTDRPQEVDLQPFNQFLATTNGKVEALAKSVGGLVSAQGNLTNSFNNLNSVLPAKLVDTLARAIKESPLGELAQRCEKMETELAQARSDAENLAQADSRRLGEVSQLQRDLEAVRMDRDRLGGELGQLRNTIETLKVQNEVERAKVDRANGETAKEKEVSAALRNQSQQGFDYLTPTKLMGGELDARVRAMYQQAMTGDVSSVAVWSTLTSFGSAQADPGAKDFQLQIVRRLGIVLVQSWKYKGLNEKERHEQLSVWAKLLNDHADGRYNLFIPGLGTPIDRARMACASTATTVREVLCWQVRNSAGANFSLAEVA